MAKFNDPIRVHWNLRMFICDVWLTQMLMCSLFGLTFCKVNLFSISHLKKVWISIFSSGNITNPTRFRSIIDFVCVVFKVTCTVNLDESNPDWFGRMDNLLHSFVQKEGNKFYCTYANCNVNFPISVSIQKNLNTHTTTKHCSRGERIIV